MNRMPLLFIGFFLTFASAWVGLVLIPYFQVGRLEPVTSPAGDILPPRASGLALEGSRVYAASGCVYCHSQQVRPPGAGSDIERGWGARRTVARDFIGEVRHFRGTMRTGPDLTNVGRRWSDLMWHYEHLYEPRSKFPGSIMPAFRYLFEVRPIQGRPSPEALRFEGRPDLQPPEGYEIVPKQEARALAHYLISLDRTYELEEASR